MTFYDIIKKSKLPKKFKLMNQRTLRGEIDRKSTQIYESHRCVRRAEEENDWLTSETTKNVSKFVSNLHFQPVLEFKSSVNIGERNLISWVLSLTLRNMEKIYNEVKNVWPWEPHNKERELKCESSRFLVAYDNNKPVGFIHFRFEQYDGDFIVYIYDIQLEDSHANTELDNLLVDVVENIAAKAKASSVVAFFFKNQRRLNDLLLKREYVPHSSSPSVYRPGKEDEYVHDVLHKPIRS